MLAPMEANTLPLSRARANSIAVVVTFALFFGALWAALYGLHAFSPFDYGRLKAALGFSTVVAILGMGTCVALPKSGVMRFLEQGSVIKAFGWLSVILALDSMLIEPYVSYLVPRFGLDYSLRWQFQLIVAGLLALIVAITKRTWRWVPFSLLATAFGLFWLLMILVPE
jgi:hypothetical protein